MKSILPKDYIGRGAGGLQAKRQIFALFEQAFDERIAWEILNEFGLNPCLGDGKPVVLEHGLTLS